MYLISLINCFAYIQKPGVVSQKYSGRRRYLMDDSQPSDGQLTEGNLRCA